MPKVIFAVPLDSFSGSDKDNSAGCLRYEDHKIYRFVKNANASVAFAIGDPVCHTISDGATAHLAAKHPATANLGLLAGVAMSAIPAGSYGWIQIQGPNPTVNVSGATTGGTAIAAGDFLKAVDATLYMVRDNATGASVYPRNIQTMVAVGTTTTPAAATIACWIRCLN